MYPIKLDSPLRNGSIERPPSPPRLPTPVPLPSLEDEREYFECTCGEDEAEDNCPAAKITDVRPYHVHALHHAYLPGINGTRAPTHPHQFAVRKPMDPDNSDLFTSIVPLYKYSDYADDYCVKNMSRVPLCENLPWTQFAPPPPEPPPPPSPPPIRPYPIDSPEAKPELDLEEDEDEESIKTEEKPEVYEYKCSIKAETPSVPSLEPSERLKAPLLSNEDVKNFGASEVPPVKMDVVEEVMSEEEDHRTVERTKEDIDGRTLYALFERALETVPYTYGQTDPAPVVTLPVDVNEGEEVLVQALNNMESDRTVDEFGRPPRPTNFTEWHECAKLGDLIALPYVVID